MIKCKLFSNKLIILVKIFLLVLIFSNISLSQPDIYFNEFPEIKKASFNYNGYFLTNSLSLYNNTNKKQRVSLNTSFDFYNNQKMVKAGYSYKNIGEIALLYMREGDYSHINSVFGGAEDKIFNLHYGNFIDVLPLKIKLRPVALLNLEFYSVQYTNYPQKYYPKYFDYNFGVGINFTDVNRWGILGAASFSRSQSIYPNKPEIDPEVIKNGFILNALGIGNLFNKFVVSGNIQFSFNDQSQNHFIGIGPDSSGNAPIREKTYTNTSLFQSYSFRYKYFIGKFNYDSYSLKFDDDLPFKSNMTEWSIGFLIKRNLIFIGLWNSSYFLSNIDGIKIEFEFFI